MLRSSKHILKFANAGKQKQLEQLFADFQAQLQYYIDLIWNKELDLNKNLSSKDIPDYIIKHSRWKQLIYKHASEIIRANIQKKKTSKPEVQNIGINIDERFIDFSSDSLEFDEFIHLKLPWFQEGKHRAETINIPIKQHKHSLKYKDWSRKNTIRLTKKNNQFFIWFTYEKEEPAIIEQGSIIAYDCGYKTLLASSKNELIGKELEQLYIKLARKKRGSKNYTQLLQHKYNEINRIINELDLDNTKLIVVENLKGVKNKSKFSKKFNNKLQYWSYAQVLDKLNKVCTEKGICLLKVSPAYTSQTCHSCGTVDKNARKGETYLCATCGMTDNADLNAAKNILHRGIYSSSNTPNTDFL